MIRMPHRSTYGGRHRVSRNPNVAGHVLAAAAMVGCLAWAGCRPAVRRGGPLTELSTLTGEPVLRVRVARAARRAILGGGTGLRLELAGGDALSVAGPVEVHWSSALRHITLRDGKGASLAYGEQWLAVRTADGGPVSVDGNPYPGQVRAVARADGAGFDLINDVKIERYLPGVLDRELYGHWQPATFEAQAIAARSYAIAGLARTSERSFDLESTQASQVYGGAVQNARATAAVDATRGMVLGYGHIVVPAYYSSCTGGLGQDAAAVFPEAPDITPLRGRYHGAWGRDSRLYRWGPIRRDRATLARRIAAWGQRRRHDVAALGAISSIKASGRNAVGRRTSYTIIGASGRRFDLDAESFRAACNHADGLPPLAAGQRLPSGHVAVRASGESVHFSDGRGFGHGVGMGQYGAEAMSRRGHAAAAILAFYYPGARLVRAY